MKKIRILYLTAEHYPTFRVDILQLFGQYLPKLGLQSDIVTYRKSNQQVDPEWAGGDALLCSTSQRSIIKNLSKFAHTFKCLLQASNKNYQAIQVRDMPYIGILALCMARIKGLPFFYWASYPITEGQIDRALNVKKHKGFFSYAPLWLRGQIGRWLLYKLLLNNADHIFVQSQKMKDNMALQGVTSNEMTPVPMGVGMQSSETNQLTTSLQDRFKGRRVLIYLGSLDSPRGIEVLFEMMAELRNSTPNILLLIVGDTEHEIHKQWLQDKANQAEVNDLLLWVGWLPIAEAWEYVQAAEVGLSPIPRGSLLDVSSPTKVIEYLALGIPVVCNDNPDQKNIIKTSKAGLCVPYTAKSFADAVEQLLSESQKVRQQRIVDGIAYVKEHRSYQVIARNLIDIYQKLC